MDDLACGRELLSMVCSDKSACDIALISAGVVRANPQDNRIYAKQLRGFRNDQVNSLAPDALAPAPLFSNQNAQNTLAGLLRLCFNPHVTNILVFMLDDAT